MEKNITIHFNRIPNKKDKEELESFLEKLQENKGDEFKEIKQFLMYLGITILVFGICLFFGLLNNII